MCNSALHFLLTKRFIDEYFNCGVHVGIIVKRKDVCEAKLVLYKKNINRDYLVNMQK